jgi:AGCS family alanine or glycine:cation symporter
MIQLEQAAGIAAEWLWGPWLLVLLMGTHLFMTVRTGFIQRKLGLGLKLSLAKDTGADGDVSHFGALSVALASTIGTGNIAGVGMAVVSGGPGAVLWMWIAGILGIATKYAESLVAIKYRVKNENGAMLGGAMLALERGLNLKWLGVLFAAFVAFASFGVGNGIQTNTLAGLFYENFGTPRWLTALLIMGITSLVLIGGIGWIAAFCKKLVPLMSAVYVLGCVIILIMQGNYIVPAITAIVRSAFVPQALTGGLAGHMMKEAARFGIMRGLFSNESGMGTSSIAAAAVQTKNPARHALVSMTGTFWDTVVICMMTGLVVVSSLIADPGIGSSGGISLVNTAFTRIPFAGAVILNFALITFTFSTVLGWSYYGEKSAEYLFGKKIVIPYRVVYVFVVYLGCIVSMNLVWNIAEVCNALMVLPNIIAVLLLSAVIARDTKRFVYEKRIDELDTMPVPQWKPGCIRM